MSKKILSNILTATFVEKPPAPPALVDYGEWNKDTRYKFTDTIQPYIYQTKNGKRQVYMLLAKESLGEDPFLDNSQGGGKIWRRQESLDLVVARKIQADDIDVDNLVVRKLKSKETGPRVEIEGSIMHVYGDGAHPNMVFGVNDDGYAVMEYYTADGVKLYDLGPSGLDVINFAPVKWTEKKLMKFSDANNMLGVSHAQLWKIIGNNITRDNSPIFYTYYAGGSPAVSGDERDREKYTYQSVNGAKIANGWYYTPPPNTTRGFMQIPSKNTGGYLKPSDDAFYLNSSGVVDLNNIYTVPCYLYLSGQISQSTYFYFQENP